MFNQQAALRTCIRRIDVNAKNGTPVRQACSRKSTDGGNSILDAHICLSESLPGLKEKPGLKKRGGRYVPSSGITGSYGSSIFIELLLGLLAKIKCSIFIEIHVRQCSLQIYLQ